MPKTYEISEAFLKDLHNASCMPDVKAVMEKHFAEVFEKPTNKVPGQIWLNDGRIAMLVYAGSNDLRIVYLHEEGWDPIRYLDAFRPMRSGIITITVKGGKMAGAVVKEQP